MGETSIEWTDFSVNPIRARLNGAVGHYCEKISRGCRECYASRLQPRFRMPQFQEQRRAGVEPFLDVSKLADVLRRKKPTKFFWCDMTDMFGAWVPDEWIAACFGVMAATPQHTHQVLTKRAERLPKWFSWVAQRSEAAGSFPVGLCAAMASQLTGRGMSEFMPDLVAGWPCWPLPNVWLGVSTEDQETADERIPHLLATPAAVRFISAEPLLAPINFDSKHLGQGSDCPECGWMVRVDEDGCCASCGRDVMRYGVDWVIVGSESGQRARAMDIAWARGIVDQCIAADVPVFTKQIANVNDRKGGDPQFWPPGEWPRQFPAGVTP